MKKLFLIAIVIFTSQKNYSQIVNSTIEKKFLEYINLLATKQIDKSFDYINDSLFTLAPREVLLQATEKLFNDPDLDVQMANPQVIKVDSTQKIGGIFYAKIIYSIVVKMKFYKLKYKADGSDKKAIDNQINQILAGLKQQFGKDNVTYNTQTGYFELFSKKTAIANSKDEINWKFAVLEERQMPLLEKIFPKELLENH